jgi:hypothetical protein
VSGSPGIGEAMGHVVRHARSVASQLGRSGFREIGELCGGAGNGSPGSELVQSLLGSGRGVATRGHSRFVLGRERLESATGVGLGLRDGLPSLLKCGVGSSASLSRSFSSTSFAPAPLFPAGKWCHLPRSSSMFKKSRLHFTV